MRCELEHKFCKVSPQSRSQDFEESTTFDGGWRRLRPALDNKAALKNSDLQSILAES
jgi:hypothetical protein